jgi:hypothetical protein
LKEIQFIEKHIAGRSYTDVTKLFNRRFGTALNFASIKEAAQWRGLYNGLDGRFEPGHRYYCKPIGSERLNGRGYVVVKIANPSVWKYKHYIIWEKAHGKIPKGHRIVFADRNKLNCDLDNLILVSQRELIVMNQNGLIFDNSEFTKIGKLIADIRILITDRKNAKEKTR